MTIHLSLVAAVARNGIIGHEGGMPWHLPTDLKHFKAVTLGKPIVMGRRTFEAIGRALPGRDNIVVTRNSDFEGEGVHVAYSLDEAVSMAEHCARHHGVDEICIIGGGQIYEEVMAHAHRLYVTEVDDEPEGDARFPDIDPSIWREIDRVGPVRGEKDSAAVTFVRYERIG